jgi:hypothetical protein
VGPVGCCARSWAAPLRQQHAWLETKDCVPTQTNTCLANAPRLSSMTDTSKSSFRCPECGSANTRAVFHPGGESFFECRECGWSAVAIASAQFDPRVSVRGNDSVGLVVTSDDLLAKLEPLIQKLSTEDPAIALALRETIQTRQQNDELNTLLQKRIAEAAEAERRAEKIEKEHKEWWAAHRSKLKLLCRLMGWSEDGV